MKKLYSLGIESKFLAEEADINFLKANDVEVIVDNTVYPFEMAVECIGDFEYGFDPLQEKVYSETFNGTVQEYLDHERFYS